MSNEPSKVKDQRDQGPKFTFGSAFAQFREGPNPDPLVEWYTALGSLVAGAGMFVLAATSPNPTTLIADSTSLLFPAAIGSVGVIIAAFAVFATLTDASFRIFLEDRGDWGPVTFPFWAAAAVWVTTTILAGATHIVNGALPTVATAVLTALSVAVFGYALGLTLSLFPVVLHAVHAQDLFLRRVRQGQQGDGGTSGRGQ